MAQILTELFHKFSYSVLDETKGGKSDVRQRYRLGKPRQDVVLYIFTLNAL